MATQTEIAPLGPLTLELKAGPGTRDFTTFIGYTRAPADGTEPRMDDLASDHPLYRDVREARVIDVRGSRTDFNLETHGFQYYKLPQVPGEGLVDFQDENDSKIMSLYYAGMCEWFAGE